jgi:hypothetical protein
MLKADQNAEAEFVVATILRANNACEPQRARDEP